MSERWSRLQDTFPVPLVAIVVLLLVLIVLTPNLESSGSPSAGSLQTEAELLVDRAPHENVTHLYVKGIGTVRYSSISVGLAKGALWPPAASPKFNFSATNRWNDTLFAALPTSANPIAVNVTVLFVDARGNAVDFVGIFEFNMTADTLYSESFLPSAGGIVTTPVTSLPLTLLLETVPLGVAR